MDAWAMSERTDSSGRDGLAVVGIVLSLVAVLAAVVGVGLGVRAVDESDASTIASAGEQTTVSLTEFSVSPGAITVAAGSTLQVVNDGSAQHDLTVEGTELMSDHLDGGGSTSFDISSLEPGSYTVFCSIAGHREAGMEGTLTVTADGAAVAGQGDDAGHDAMSYEEMDEAMKARTAAFPAETEGAGAQELAPAVLEDGTKQFELTASEIDWEIEPGKVVKAMAYNEQVPGPTIRVAVGDNVRVIVNNELDESTAVHFHGMFTPNTMDGVPDITQDPIEPGESFTYEFVAREAQVGMSESSRNATRFRSPISR